MKSSYEINARKFTLLAPLADELNYRVNLNYLFELNYLTGINVCGDNAQAFLQGQLSCDVHEVDINNMRQAALCNLQGKILALMDVIDWHGRGLQLILALDLRGSTQLSLAKPAMLSRVILEHASAYQVFGFYLQNNADLIPFELEPATIIYGTSYNEYCCCYHLGNNFYIILVLNEYVQKLHKKFSECSQLRGSLAWHELQLRYKNIEIYPLSRAMFLPQRLSLTRYLSFTKGCYRGQEIIARIHYRSVPKHELKLFIIESELHLCAGQKIFKENRESELGEIVDYCPIGDAKFLIAASMVFDHPLRVVISDYLDPLVLQVV